MATPKDQIVGLNTLTLRSQAPGLVSTPLRAHKKRVFTDDEYNKLLGCTTENLKARIKKGELLIALLSSPQMMNMTPQRAAMVSSNLRYQIDAIWEIIKERINNGLPKDE